jgi:FtsH-binding integral membrane protein
MPTYDQLGATNLGAGELTRDRSHQVFGQVMGLVAFTFGFAALGAYVGRNLTGGTGILFFIGAFACIFGLNIASSRGHEQLSVALLFGLGLLLGLAIAPVIKVYADADPAALWQAAGATGAFVAALLALIVFGLVTIFVSIPHANIIYAVLGLVIFGGYTIFDFNRLRRANMASAVPIAAGIFLDVFNIFLFFLQIFGGGGRN